MAVASAVGAAHHASSQSIPPRVALTTSELLHRYVPVFSWGLKMCGFLYLSRSWETDRARMKRWALAMARDKVRCLCPIPPEPEGTAGGRTHLYAWPFPREGVYGTPRSPAIMSTTHQGTHQLPAPLS
jgi:hypothetical protein